MKKLLCLTLALVLALSLAAAQEAPGLPLTLSVLEDGEYRLTGTAVRPLDSDGLLVVLPTSAFYEGASLWVDAGAERVRLTNAVRLGDTGLALAGTGDGLTEGIIDKGIGADPALAWGVNAEGVALTARVTRSAFVTRDGVPGWFITTAEGLLPGAALYGADGDLVGVVTASWGEGRGNYAAVSLGVLAQPETYPPAAVRLGTDADDAAAAAAGETDDGWLRGFSFKLNKGILTVSWAGIGQLTGETVRVYYQDVRNDYLTWADCKLNRGIAELYVLPGHTYVVWARVLPPSGEADGPDMTTPYEPFEVPAGEPLTDYAFWNEQWIAVTEADAAPGETEELPRAESVSAADVLAGRTRVWLQAVSSYEVEKDIEAPMAIAVTYPDGHVEVQEGGFIFMRSIQDRDVWHSDITELFEDIVMQDTFVAGTYTVTVVIGGLVADETEFTVGE